MSRKQTDSARIALERAQALFPDYAGPSSPAQYLAGLAAERGDYREAVAQVTNVTTRSETAWDANMMEVQLREKIGDTLGTRAPLERLLWISPYDVELHEKLAELASRTGDHRTALRERRAILALNPPDPIDARYQLARALAASGDVAAARRELLSVLEQAPSFEKGQALLLELRAAAASQEHTMKARPPHGRGRGRGHRGREPRGAASRLGAGPVRRSSEEVPPNPAYDGRFTFVRIRYDQGSDGGFDYRRDIKWAHDYPRGERHFTKILGEITGHPVAHGGEHDPHARRPRAHPVPGRLSLRAGILASVGRRSARPAQLSAQGRLHHLRRLRRQPLGELPGADAARVPRSAAVRMTPDDKVFDAFYHITTLNYNHPYFGMPSEFWGIYENNDRDGRLLAMINYNNDISEYWEFSDEQFFPVNMSNDAYKLGINYLVYALTR
jgi:hypothetical protein